MQHKVRKKKKEVHIPIDNEAVNFRNYKSYIQFYDTGSGNTAKTVNLLSLLFNGYFMSDLSTYI